jgi:hypothetical protein
MRERIDDQLRLGPPSASFITPQAAFQDTDDACLDLLDAQLGIISSRLAVMSEQCDGKRGQRNSDPQPSPSHVCVPCLSHRTINGWSSAPRAIYRRWPGSAIRCPGSVHMRRVGLAARAIEILVWSLPAKSAVGPVMVIEVGEGVDVLIEAIEAVREVVTGIELVAP